MRKKPRRLTHEQVQEALKRFVRSGGMIAKLPDQKTARSEFIGQEKYDTYESLSSLMAS